MRVCNLSSKPRALPSGAVIPVGAVVEVDDAAWSRDQSNPVVSKWLTKGLIVADQDSGGVVYSGGEGGEDDSDTAPGHPDEADELIAKLAGHGIERTRRTSVEKLRELLSEAESDA